MFFKHSTKLRSVGESRFGRDGNDRKGSLLEQMLGNSDPFVYYGLVYGHTGAFFENSVEIK